ncbi:MAG: TrmH family RNA methyltransferase [Lentisphaeria bacterium]|nr:TrmH family RNA methyltransferase [Lentisphaeria bacterium]
MKEKVIIVLDRLRSAHNVGNIFRIAEALGVSEIIACGYTPVPPHPRLVKTAMGTDEMVPFRTFATSLDAVNALRREGVREILAAEPLPGSVPVWRKNFNFPLAVIFGNEALGVHPETLKTVDGTVCLPMYGKKASINVGNAAAAILYAIEARSDLS